MLLFIRRTCNTVLLLWIIQIHLMLLFICSLDLESQKIVEFKYISCYCLSSLPVSNHAGKKRFKYISCYCLSLLMFQYDCMQPYSNTSHVIVYQGSLTKMSLTKNIQIHLMLLFIETSMPRFLRWNHSNTSHVIVYRTRLPSCCHRRSIQIHLMLLFIVG